MTLASDAEADAATAPPTAGPLDGCTATATGGSVPLDLAARHLRALGCATSHDAPGDPGTPPAAAGRLGLTVPERNGAALRAGCAIDWAGPVRLPIEDETTAQAACGIMHVHGRKAGAPLPVGVDFASAVTGVLAVHGLLAAAVSQARGGAVRDAATSVAQGALLSVGQYLAAATAPDDWPEPPRPGGPPFVSADGVRFEIETLDPEGWRRFWTLLGADRSALARGWRPFQHRYATATSPLPDGLHGIAATRPYDALADAAAEAGISILPVRATADPPPAEARDRVPWRIAPYGTANDRVPAAPPATASTSPLAGIVVVESTRRVQGPLAGHLLRMLGAEVCRIEPPGGDPLRGMPPMVGDCSARFLALNRGKRVVEADIRSEAGRRRVRELIAGADVFLHNWAPGKAAQLGLDATDLFAARPGLVYAHASGWRDALGPRPPLGTDFLVQARSGLGALVRPAGEPPAPSLMTLTDVLGALVCVEAVLAGLLARCRTGRGQRVDSSLFDAAAVLIGTVRACGEAGTGVRLRGRPVWTQLHRPLPTRDGYLALGTRARREPERVAKALGARRSTAEAIAARCRDATTEEATTHLRAAALPAAPVCTDLPALATDIRVHPALMHEGVSLVGVPWGFLP